MKRIAYVLSVLIYVLSVLSALLLAGCASETDNAETLAKCLSEKGAVMYGTEWCPHCQNQKKAFGSAFEGVDYVDCDKYASKCEGAGIQGYPTWVIKGRSYPGEQPLNRLSSLAGC